MKLTVKDIALITVLTSILFVQEQLLLFLPNIQLTFFLIILYSKKLGLKRSSYIVILYTVLDSLYMNAFDIIYFPFLLISWLIIPLSINTIFKRINSTLYLSVLSILYALIFSFIMMIPQVLVLNIPVLAYLASDIYFQIILATSSFISTYLLYEPLEKVFNYI